MVRRVLVALDGSKGSWRALRYAARVFAGAPKLKVGLVQVVPESPSSFWDFGHILTSAEERSVRGLARTWGAAHERRWEATRAKALGLLAKTGAASAEGHLRRTDLGAAEGILEEAESGGYDTIVLGRRGAGASRSALLGSVAHRVLQRAKGRAVVVVE